MAYFKNGPEAESAKQALDAAVTMHCYNDQVISPKLKALSFPEVKFRVGIETGLLTNARRASPIPAWVASGERMD